MGGEEEQRREDTFVEADQIELVGRIHVRGARGLAKADTFGKSDPFARVLLDDKEVGKTEVVKKTLDPDWER